MAYITSSGFPTDPRYIEIVNNYCSRPSYRIEKVIFNPPATIVFWRDTVEKTVVKCRADETFDKEKGLAMAICKRLYGKEFHKVFKTWCKEESE